MSHRSGSIGVFAVTIFGVAVFTCLYLVAGIRIAFAGQKIDALHALAFTNAFLAQSSHNAATRISAQKAVALSQNSESKAMAMPLVLPLFLTDSKFNSTLVLVNGGGAVTYADVVIRDADGNETASRRVNFAPHSRQTLDIAAALAKAGSAASEGSVVITPSSQATSETIAAQLSMTYFGSSEPNYVDEEVAMPTPDSSQVLRAAADPGDGSPIVAITSLSRSVQRVTVNCLGEGEGAFSKQIALAPNATFVGPACTVGDSRTNLADLDEPNPDPGQGHRRATGIALTSDGAPGSFAAYALQAHRTKDGQFFSSVPFSDPKMLMSANWVFAGVPVGAVDQLPGNGYTPEISLANFSSKARSVTITYASTSTNAPSAQTLRTVLLPAGTSKHVSFPKLQGDPAIQNSFVVSSDGAPGDILAKLVSKSDDGVREVELMGKDEMDTDNGGNHPWSIENGADATLLLFNPTNSAQYFNVILSGGGVTWYKAYHLQPMQTESIGIRQLIQNRVKDDKGKTLPADTQEGQVDWYVPATNAGRGRILETNKAMLMARNFSCGGQIEICEAGFVANYPYVGDDDQPITYAQVTTEVCMNQCSGTVLGQGGSGYSYSWSVSGAPQISGSSTNQSVELYGTSAGSGTANAEVSDGYCQLQTGGPAPVVNQTPTSITLTSKGQKKTYNGTNMSDCNGNLIGVRWGYSYCAIYTVLDQNKNALQGGSYTAQESFQYVSSNPSNIVDINGNANLNNGGQFGDFLAFVTTSSPGPTNGQYKIEKQFWSIKDNSNGQLFQNLRTNCLNFQYSDVTITDITTGGTCP